MILDSLTKAASKSAKGAIKEKMSGKLEKACFVVYEGLGDRRRVKYRADMQFNPSEYRIHRGMKLSKKKGLGTDTLPSGIQTVHGESSVLSFSLYFDSYTELQAEPGMAGKGISYLTGKGNEKAPQAFPSFDMNEDLSPPPDYRVNELFTTFLSLVKYDPKQHTPPQVGFIWSKFLHFVGKLSSYDVQYTVFDKDGTPVRAKIAMRIIGEEIALTELEQQYPRESPDRTKQRTLHYGDQLWMMAQEEYGDVAHWKTIAQANGILNPRTISGAARLKVPSIR